MTKRVPNFASLRMTKVLCICLSGLSKAAENQERPDNPSFHPEDGPETALYYAS